MKKVAVIFILIGILALGGYFIMRNSINTPGFTPAQAKEPDAATATPQSALDIRPQLIKKFQQLVKLGSNGLYNLNVHLVNPDILNSTISISNALLSPDTAFFKQLDLQKKLPDDLFKIKADSIWIDGLGVKDVLLKDRVDVKTIHLFHPRIDVYSKKRAYNKTKDPKTLYQRLMNQMKHIGIGKIIIENGTLVTHNTDENKSTPYKNITINLSDIVIDSTTQFDKSRFLFAKEATFSMKNHVIPSSDNLYDFKMGSILITATKNTLIAKNLVLEPRYNKEDFQKHLKTMKERYVLTIPSVEFKNINWWGFINKKILKADAAQISNAKFDVYLDRRLPPGPPSVQDFPNQLLMQLPLKVDLSKVDLHNLNISYEEFSPQSGKPGTLYIDNMQATISNVTNMPQAIKKNKFTTISATGVFMHMAPADLTIKFDMSNYKTGAFSASLQSKKSFDGTLINSIAEPLGLFKVKRGELKKLSAQMKGNNYNASGNVILLYDNLNITPLKKDSSTTGGLKKKSVTNFVANTFVLKDQNPAKNGDVRKANLSTKQKPGASFFNLLWKIAFKGILKTIGAPQKLAGQ